MGVSRCSRKADGGLKEMSCRWRCACIVRGSCSCLPRATAKEAPAESSTPSGAPPSRYCPEVHELPGVHLELVLSRPDSALWNEYIDRSLSGVHPTGGGSATLLRSLGGPHPGPAWLWRPRLENAPRDRFIGWGPSQRESNLQLIVNNARLILPWVQSKNLASNCWPWPRVKSTPRARPAETFVTPSFTGACYKAANWIQVGQTQGRGKMDRDHTADLPTKSIWLYPLSKHFRRSLRST